MSLGESRKLETRIALLEYRLNALEAKLEAQEAIERARRPDPSKRPTLTLTKKS